MAEQGQAEMMARLCQTMLQVMQDQNTTNRVEMSITQGLQNVVQKVGWFDGRNASKYLKTFESEMQLQGIGGQRTLGCFHRISAIEVSGNVNELQINHGASWNVFKTQLLHEYAVEDQTRVTRKSFNEWIGKRNKDLLITDLLHEFNRQFSQLSTIEQSSLALEKVDLLLQAVDETDRRDLEPLLEDPDTDNGLVTDWQVVRNACRKLSKRVQRKGKQMLGSGKLELLPSLKKLEIAQGVLNKPNVEESWLEELVKGVRDLNIRCAKLEEAKSSPRENFVRRCIWCDSPDHERRECISFKDALNKDIVYFKEGKIHASETRLPLIPNYGKGGMKKTMDEEEEKKHSAMYHSAIAGVQVACKEDKSEFWTNVIKFAKRKIVAKEELLNAGDCIRSKTGWNDPVDSLSAFAFVQDHEAIVDEKRRRTDNDASTSKKYETRSGGRKDAEIEGKDKGKIPPTYKLQSDIENSIDIKKVLEERILNSRVEFTLKEVLGIAKREFHEDIIDIIRRKRQTVDGQKKK